MKKILAAIAALAMVAGLASCNKENIAGNGNGEINKTTITATFAEPSKVAYSENGNNLQPSWEENDIVLGIASDGTPFKLTVVSINSYIATLEGVDVPSGDVTLIYVSGVETTDYDTTNKKYVISYNAQNGDKTMPAIMTASGTIDNGCGEFEFNNDGAVLGISNVGASLNGKAINQVTLYGKKLASSADVSYSGVTFNYVDGYNVISTKVLGDITVGGDGALNENILMAVPAEAEVDSVFIRTTEGEVYSLGSSNKDPMSPSDYRYIKNANFKRDAYRDAMILTGVFTVKDEDLNEKQVFFSKGNLTYSVTDTKWSFYEHQYDCAANGDASSTLISLFTWGYNATYSVKPTGSDFVGGHDTEGNKQLKHSTDGDDWGVAYCNSNNIAVGTWRTLSTAEWQYLFNGRDNASNLYKGGVTVCGKTNCVVLLHDNWEWDETADEHNVGTGWQDGGYPETQTGNEVTWERMEKSGAVCLPAAGYRSGSIVYNVGDNGYYWSATADDEYGAFSVYFFSYYVRPSNSDYRGNGCSVRLITEVK